VILINHKDRRPIYEQIIERFEQLILCGALETNAPMPSVRSLAMELSLNPNTIQRAYQELERAGYIYTIKGKGSFVSETSQNADKKRQEVKKEMREGIEEALFAGISAQELRQMLEECIEEAKKGRNGG
jgi:GntR family transcriptional regulator